MSGDPRIQWAGDSAVIVSLEERIDPTVSRRAAAMGAAIASAAITGVRDIVPTYCAVTIHFDPVRVDRPRLLACLDGVAGAIEAKPVGAVPKRVPVCYGGSFGPDLRAVAARAGMSEKEVVGLHAGVRYQVLMLGFMPGFAYLGPVDPRIAVPRRGTPRVRVPRGAVGLAGGQTGVYPGETPGGWQIVGRTPIRMFDPSRSEAFLLGPGDTVEFHAINAGEYGDRMRAVEAG